MVAICILFPNGFNLQDLRCRIQRDCSFTFVSAEDKFCTEPVLEAQENCPQIQVFCVTQRSSDVG